MNLPLTCVEAPVRRDFPTARRARYGGAEDESARNATFYRSRCEKTRVNSRLTGQKGRLTGIYCRFAQISKCRLRFIAEIVVLLL